VGIAMRATRRTFILGVAALITSPAITSGQKFLGQIATGELPPIPYRRIDRISLGNAVGIEEKIAAWEMMDLTILRDDEVVLIGKAHPLNGFLFVALPGEGIEISERSTFRITIEPCHSRTSLMIASNIERDRTQRPRYIHECYRWTDGKLELESAAAASYKDQDSIAQLGLKPRPKSSG
jgi:hypothetical protein